MAKERMICPFSNRLCEDCALYRGRHYYLCFNQRYRGYISAPGKLAEENPEFMRGARSNGRFEIPVLVRTNAIDPFTTNHEDRQKEIALKMLIEGKLTLQEAPIQEVWDFLLKPENLVACVPGAEKIESADNKTYESIVRQEVGPVQVRFQFTTTLTETDPPRYLKAVGRGADIGKGKAGTFTQETTVHLTEISEDTVEIAYRSNVSLVGRLATFGERIRQAKARELEQDLTRNLQERLRSQVTGRTKT